MLSERTEKAFQLLHLESTQPLLELQKSIVPDLFEANEHQAICELTEKVRPALHHPTTKFRHLSLIALFRSDDLILEIESCLESPMEPDRRAELYLMLARAYGAKGALERSVQMAEFAARHSKLENKIEALLVKAKWMSVADSIRLLEEVEKSLPSLKDPDSRLLAEFHFSSGFCAAATDHYSQAVYHFPLAAHFYKKAGNRYKELVARANYVTALYDAGQIQASQEYYEALQKEIVGKSELKFLRLYQARHLSLMGDYKHAKAEILGQVHSMREQIPLQTLDNYALYDLALIAVKDGDYSFAIQALSDLNRNRTAPADKTIRHKIGFLKDALHTIRHSGLAINFDRFSSYLEIEKSSEVKLEMSLQALEFGWQSGFAGHYKKFVQELTRLLELPSLSTPNRFIGRCLLGLYEVLRGDAKLARVHLENAATFFDFSGLELWSLRAKLGLALADCRAGQVDQALTRVRTSASFRDFGFDSRIQNFLKEIFSWKVSSQNEDLPTDLLARVCDGFDFMQNGSFLHLLRCLSRDLGLKKIQPIRVFSRRGEYLALRYSLHLDSRAESVLLVDELESIISFEGESLRFKKRDLLPALLRALIKAAGCALEKEQLANAVWNESYNPRVHDLRIYTAVKRLRNWFKKSSLKGSPILCDKGQYSMSPELSFFLLTDLE